MKVGKRLTLLGFVKELAFEVGDGSQYIARFLSKRSWSPKGKGATVLAASHSKKSVFLLPWKNVKVVPIKSESKLYTDWSGYETDRAFEIKVPEHDLKRCGRILWIDYSSDKWERAGDGRNKFNIYRHKYRRPPVLYTDNKKNTWAITAPKGHRLVSPRGLIG